MKWTSVWAPLLALSALLLVTSCGAVDGPTPAGRPSMFQIPPAEGSAPAAPPLAGYYPAPRLVLTQGPGPVVSRVCVDTSALPSHHRLDALIADIAGRRGVQAVALGETCPWTIGFAGRPALDPRLRDALAGAPAEAFGVETHGTRTLVIAGSEAAAAYGLDAALAFTGDAGGARQLYDGGLVDWPDLPLRGVVEGFYGTPYTPDEREQVLLRMSRARHNTYLYAPQNEDYAHGLWAEPYPDDQAAALAAAAALARARLIDFVWAFRPAVNAFGYTVAADSIRFTDDDDFARLVAKLTQLLELGIEQFGLLIDDSAPPLYWATDQAAFTSPAEAHASLANRLQAWLTTVHPGARLWFVGNAYSSASDGWRDYNTTLGALLDPAIRVMWTGPKTYSDKIAAADLTEIDGLLGREVVIWDNAPTLVAALSGRSADLHVAASGFLSNAVMNEWRHHSVADFESILGTLAAYAWNNGAYDPTAALDWWSAVPP